MPDAKPVDLGLARGLIDEGKADEAIDALRGPGAPDDAGACALLALAYYRRGDTRGDVYSGHFFAERALDLGYTESWVFAIKAVCAFRKEQYGEAAEAFASYVTPDGTPAGRHLFGLSLLYDGRPEEAMPWLERSAAAWPGNPGIEAALAQAGGALEDPGAAPEPADEEAPEQTATDDRKPARYPFRALSREEGRAAAPKDFEWLARNIPCQEACPAHTDIPGYLAAIYRGEYDLAYRINLRDNVFPAVLGRVCSRPCEDACRHGWEGLGDPVAICFSKRSAADFKDGDPVDMEPWAPPTGKKVAVVGGGVAGLAAARNLALLGHGVTVYERHDKPGGMMNQGIPEFRLPRDCINREIEQVRRTGVSIECGVEVGEDLPLAELVDGHDAVVLAGGTLRPNVLDLPGRELDGIRHGLDFLLEANETGRAEVGRHVVVIGGGFTAMDCARTARRLGADATRLEPEESAQGEPGSVLRAPADLVRVWYRRSVNEMLVTPGELEELEHESIPMEFMVSPKAYLGEDGRVARLRFVRTRLGEPDASGRRRPVEVPDSEFEVAADTVLLATGQFPDTSWIEGAEREELVGEDGWLAGGAAVNTGLDKVFAAGDYATGARSLIDAIAHAKECARAVDAFLMGEERLLDIAVIDDVPETGRIREMDEVERQQMPSLPLEERGLVAEVETGYMDDDAVEEAQRCYFCHFKYEIDSDRCIYCDWCIKAKPRPDCIIKVSAFDYDAEGRITGFHRATSSEDTQVIWVNQEDCIRCNACVDACPVDCISLQKVSRAVVAGVPSR